jgi:hypothetical protein
MGSMRKAVVLLLLSAGALAAFAWWGTSTVAGRARYDEMDGLYPFGAGLLAAFLAVLGVALGWSALRRAHREVRRQRP